MVNDGSERNPKDSNSDGASSVFCGDALHSVPNGLSHLTA
jgi:hypothetical protein